MPVVTLLQSSEKVRHVYGRGMNTQSDVYKLPVDAEEHDRLTLQHRIWKLLLGGGGLYPQDVQDTIDRLLSSNLTSSPPAVLDLGSGSGVWVAEMAAMYPHAEVIGLDLAEPQLQKNLFLQNCRFETADLTKGLDTYRETFDVVHCRCVAGHLRDRRQLMREIAKVLKPGGLLLLADGNLDFYTPDGSRVLPASQSPVSTEEFKPKGSWTAFWFEQLAAPLSVDSEYTGGNQVGWLIQQESKLKYIGERAYFSPVCLRKRGRRAEKSSEEEREEELATLTSRNITNFIRTSKTILLAAGTPQEVVEDWSERALAEISNPDPEETWNSRWDMAWAIKEGADSDAGNAC